MLGLAGCSYLNMEKQRPNTRIIVEGEERAFQGDTQQHEQQALINSLFIKRSATVNGQTVFYYVDRSDPGKIYTMRQEKSCPRELVRCIDDRFFDPPEESLRQQLLAIEAARPSDPVPPTAPPALPVLPKLLPDTRITVPTLPPVALPQD